MSTVVMYAVEGPDHQVTMVAHASAAKAVEWVHREKYRDQAKAEFHVWATDSYAPEILQSTKIAIYEANYAPLMREPTGPVGSALFTCDEDHCGHKWSEHDDQGCLYSNCFCHLPGERK